jgi:hypothetical protein
MRRDNTNKIMNILLGVTPFIKLLNGKCFFIYKFQLMVILVTIPMVLPMKSPAALKYML